MSYSAVLMVGLPANELFEEFTDEALDNYLDLGLDYASTGYDNPVNEWVIGYLFATSCESCPKTLEPETFDELYALSREFQHVTGKQARFILTNHVS